MSVVKPISKTLPVGLCRNYATGRYYRGGKRVALCLLSRLKEASLDYCSSGKCSGYDPERYGFEGGGGDGSW